MTSILKVDNIKDSANNQAIAISSGNLTIPGSTTFTGAVTGSGTRQLLRAVTITSNTTAVEFIHGSNGVVLDSTYSRHEITIDSAVTTSTGQQLNLYCSSNGGSSYFGDSAYNSTYHRHYSNGSSHGNDNAYVNDFALNADQGTATAANKGGMTGTIIVDNLGVAHRTVFNGQFFSFGHGSYYIHTNSIGAYESNTAIINALKIKFRSGDISSGIFKLYGVR